MPSCPFCERIQRGEYLAESELAVAVPADPPQSNGHSLVLPRRHEPSLLALSELEQQTIWQLVREVSARLQEEHAPDGLCVSIKMGVAAGQTVPHVHVDVLPRFRGFLSPEPPTLPQTNAGMEALVELADHEGPLAELVASVRAQRLTLPQGSSIIFDADALDALEQHATNIPPTR